MRTASTYLSFMIMVLSCTCVHARADDAGNGQFWIPQLLGAQYTGIGQHLYPFPAKYSGPLGLTPDGDTQISHTFGVYSGMQITPRLQAYLDVEMFKGGGIGGATGLGGITNGDVVRAGSGLPKDPYIARAYLQYTLPLGGDTAHVDRGMDQLPGEILMRALTVKLGKLSLADDFDQNRYADSTRTQFENWDFINDVAWDYAADTRGYTDGLMLDYAQPTWALKFGLYRMPERANQEALEWPLTLAHGENLELDLMPNQSGTVLRLLAYRNVARMGIYSDAIAIARTDGTQPNIVADDAAGRVKHGFALNVEQPVADQGGTGLFGRLGWNDGHTESFVYTEVDRTVSIGMQFAGAHWGRADDRLGIAVAYNGLASAHRQYLEAGGCGFELCDGALNYGYEQIMETYYRIQAGKCLQISPDVQFIRNPGYNRDRGPARVISLRLHWSL